MTNDKKFEDILSKMKNFTFGVDTNDNGKPKSCHQMECRNCVFYDSNDEECHKNPVSFIDWYFDDYIEPPKLSKEDKAFLDNICSSTDWAIHRDSDDWLLMVWDEDSMDEWYIDLNPELFKFIKNGSTIPIRELKNMEVDDD